MIAVSNLVFGYAQGCPVLKGLSFEAGLGEIINILGPNGCGKSTLLRAILGFLPLDRGMVTVDGTDVLDFPKDRLARKLAYVPQNHHGVFHYSALEVVLMGRTSASPWYTVTEEDYAAAHAAMEKINIACHAAKPYLELSGGERQLVLIARALAQGADFFIMDEPVTGLDYGNQFRLLESIRTLADDGLSFILTTHHPEHAIFLGGRALLVKDGVTLADGPSQDVITSSCICDLYGMPMQLLQRIVNIYGKNYGTEAKHN